MTFKRTLAKAIRDALGAAARFSPVKTPRFGYPDRILEVAPWLQQAAGNEKPAYVKAVHFLPERKVRTVPPPKQVKESDPLLWEWTRNWKPRQRYIVTLDGARVSSNTVIAPDHTILWELSFLWNVKPDQHPLLRNPVLPAAVHLPGKSLFLGVDSADNYFHWLLDLLLKFKVLKDSGQDHLGFDHYLVNSQKHEFQRESLQRLGIPASKIVVTSQLRHLSTETLVVPSLVDQSGLYEREDMDWVRESLMRSGFDSAEGLPRRIFISRQKARGRNIRNFDALKAVLDAHKVTVVELESLTFSEQIRLFQHAEMVVGPHGAGLTNCLFCAPGTQVLELVSPEWSAQMYYYLAVVLDLDYCYLIGEAVTGEDRIFQDLVVDVAEVKRALTAFNAKKETRTAVN